MSILMEIAEKTKLRVKQQKELVPLNQLREAIKDAGHTPRPFADIFRHTGLNVIAEIKRASPSRGDIALNLDPVAVADAYLQAGAHALSVLTEPYYFKGDIAFLKAIRERHPKAALLMVVNPLRAGVPTVTLY